MKMKYAKMMVAAAALTSATAMGAGFGLYEASARGLGMGNGLVGSTGDASANYYNPANLTELSSPSVMVGMTLINPFCDVEVGNVQQQKMNAGWFPPPHVYVALPVMEDLVFGFGTYCEYGLGTKYDSDWALKGDTTETTIQQFTLNPNLAYKVTEDWSVSFGARMSYLSFENYKSPYFGVPTQYGMMDMYGRTKLKGDDFNCGYQLSTQYKVTDALSLGLVYRSRINHRVEGDFDLTTPELLAAQGMVPPHVSGDAKAKLVLPASVTMGANYDFTETFRGGASLTWTEWSTINHIDFNLPVNSYTQNLNWHDAWRIGFGFEYDLTDAFTGRIGYTFDWDPSADAHGTTMLPPGDRHIIGFGASYKFLDNWRVDLGYSFIIMESETRMVDVKNNATGTSNPHRFECDNSYSHLISASIAYTF